MKYWEIIADNLRKPDGVGAASQPWICTGRVMLKYIAQTGENVRLRSYRLPLGSI